MEIFLDVPGEDPEKQVDIGGGLVVSPRFSGTVDRRPTDQRTGRFVSFPHDWVTGQATVLNIS